MKKILSLLTILIIVSGCLVIASAKPRKKQSTIIGGAAGTGARVRRSTRGAIGAGGAGTYNRRRPVVEREQLEVRKKHRR